MILVTELFKAPSERNYRKYKGNNQHYIPSAKDLGVREDELMTCSDNEMKEAIETYNNWLIPILKKKKEERKERALAKTANHWHRTLSKSEQKRLILKSLKIQTRVLTQMMVKNPSSSAIYVSAEQASEETFNFKHLRADQIKNLPRYNKELDCLVGGNTLFVYLWIVFFNKKKKEVEERNAH